MSKLLACAAEPYRVGIAVADQTHAVTMPDGLRRGLPTPDAAPVFFESNAERYRHALLGTVRVPLTCLTELSGGALDLDDLRSLDVQVSSPLDATSADIIACAIDDVGFQQ